MGFTVFAGVKSAADGRKLAAKSVSDAKASGSSGNLIPIVLDVTDPQSLRLAYEQVCRVIGVATDQLGDDGGVIRSPSAKTTTAAKEAAEALVVRALSPARSRLSYSVTYDEEVEEFGNLKTGSSSSAAAPSTVNPDDLFIGIVNCEGTESPGALEVVPLAEIMRCYEVNTAGRESKGRIVNVCSSVGVTAAPINGSYAASKMALIAVSESLRIELYPFGISVSIIEPGSLDASSWAPKKESEAGSHSLQLGNNVSVYESAEFAEYSAPAFPVVTRSKSRSLLRMSAPPPSSLPSLTEDDEIPYVAPQKKVTNRRGSGSVDENNRPSSPQVFPYQSGLASPTSPTIGSSSIPLPTKRRSLSSLTRCFSPQIQRASTSMAASSPSAGIPNMDGYHPRLERIVVPSSGIHPTWDATDRARVAKKLYGPLMETVAEASATAEDRDRPSRSTDPNYIAPAKPRRRGQSVGPLLTQSGAAQRAAELGVATPSVERTALTSSCRHVSRAIVHGLTSPFPKTRYHTSVLRWALPDRFLDWGFVAMSSGASGSGGSTR
ncbi:hypothetical protein BCR33DRAFT_715234 [Rhizoclosmatium globosum]|uniref:NAD(P)-binding protein n=1 Tax=Rhizoclosmatium globosum TaxID=329046 RepID=A0A1Y2CIF8_9FUNG|nr:hypothetical protein BCR33DRAFT_715234 [Rhizoclosmatium globosum]|eukprot:ORY46802.1 hypothetical protein BCR33DRAFT_715234 [Rhizoclosmatium globosum]